ncbi:MAG: hypothetical protein ACK5O2_15660 [Microthrixaceae bacterium]
MVLLDGVLDVVDAPMRLVTFAALAGGAEEVEVGVAARADAALDDQP